MLIIKTLKTTRTLVAALLAAGTFTVAPALAETPYTLDWTRQSGTTGADESYSVAVDGAGNAYISGYTEGSLNGASAGSQDAFLTKYDASGNVAWARQLGTTGGDFSNGVAVDGAGNAYISGDTHNALGGPLVGGQDVFLTKYDTLGTLAWSRQLGTTGNDYSRSVAVDGTGNAYISGYTYGSLVGTNAGGADAFLTKYDTLGTLAWTRQLGTTGNDVSHSVAVDGSGNAYISGYTDGSLNGANAGSVDAFLNKYDTSGNLQWGRQLGTTTADFSNAVAVDAAGNAYISGLTLGSMDGPNAGVYDAFLTKYDASGTLDWTRQLGTTAWDESNSVTVDDTGNIYISGKTQGSLQGTNPGGHDAFLTKYDTSGNLLWTVQLGTSSQDFSNGVAVDGSGNAYISGQTLGGLDGPNAGRSDAFIAKYSVPEPTSLAVLGLGGLMMITRRRRA